MAKKDGTLALLGPEAEQQVQELVRREVYKALNLVADEVARIQAGVKEPVQVGDLWAALRAAADYYARS